MMGVTRRVAAAVAAMLLGGFVAPLGSGVARAQAEPGPDRAPPITVTTLHGPSGEPLDAPSPLAERPARALNERGQVVATIGPDILGRGDVVLWDQGVATRISPDGVKAHPTDISDSGQVVGDCDPQRDLSACPSPFSWEDGEWRSLPVPDGTLGAARAVNNVGQVVGFLTVYSNQGVTSKVKVVAWSGDELVEAPVDIEVTGPRPVEAVDINDRGQALFNVFDYDTGEGSAYLWDVGGGAVEIESVEAIAVNNNGQVVGRVSTGDGYHAVLWEDGEMTDLGTLGGSNSRATAINDRGQVVGISYTESGDEDWHAFLWEDGEMTDLGSLGGPESQAVDINNDGQVVGVSGPPPDESKLIGSHAFVWEDGEMTDLTALLEPAPPGAVARFSSAFDINDRGQIVGSVNTLIDFTTPWMSDVVLWTLPPSG